MDGDGSHRRSPRNKSTGFAHRVRIPYNLLMGLFGRESEAQKQRIEGYTRWIHARDSYSLGCLLLGIIAVVDSFTMVIGVGAGVAAIVLSILGNRRIGADGDKLSRRFCWIGLALGIIGIGLAITMATVIYPMIEQARGN